MTISQLINECTTALENPQHLIDVLYKALADIHLWCQEQNNLQIKIGDYTYELNMLYQMTIDGESSGLYDNVATITKSCRAFLQALPQGS